MTWNNYVAKALKETAPEASREEQNRKVVLDWLEQNPSTEEMQAHGVMERLEEIVRGIKFFDQSKITLRQRASNVERALDISINLKSGFGSSIMARYWPTDKKYTLSIGGTTETINPQQFREKVLDWLIDRKLEKMI
ncbi:hypothetical protein [Rhizobium miluonense]|uniref:Uncharacterized protein n=1 Tax=Rhizobium miluonense TaxID=411945 RepID=A0ABU1SR97_9HYPH|nr:hypothetical protein [Rhizobium miluonense]MDR6901504.1 hypothetical protein [Rhizobium miluonense]